MAGGYYHLMVDYYESTGVDIPSAFRDEDPSKFALIDLTIERRPILLVETFDYPKQIYDYLKVRNLHPLNYQVLNFKAGREFVWSDEWVLEKADKFMESPPDG